MPTWKCHKTIIQMVSSEVMSHNHTREATKENLTFLCFSQKTNKLSATSCQCKDNLINEQIGDHIWPNCTRVPEAAFFSFFFLLTKLCAKKQFLYTVCCPQLHKVKTTLCSFTVTTTLRHAFLSLPTCVTVFVTGRFVVYVFCSQVLINKRSLSKWESLLK